MPLIQQRKQGIEFAVTFAGLSQITLHQWQVPKVSAFAVAIIQARKYPENLDVALHTHPFEIAIEIGEIMGHRQGELSCLLPITDYPIQYAFLIPVNVGILEQ